MTHQETIFALSSGAGAAGVAVIRVSGLAVPSIVEKLGIGPLQPRLAKRVRLLDPSTGDLIDDALALHFPAPKSYTGEDIIELHVHGGRAVIAAVLVALSRIEGCRLAEPGEFTRRAFHHGKLDLTEAEGLADLIAAETEAQRRQALRVAGGALRELYDDWRGQLIEAMALTEAALDFSDEADVAAGAIDQAVKRVRVLHERIGAHLHDGRRGEILREGLKVVIAGPPNAGKSSLLNALARRDVAIVSPEPGTTRDVIEARLDLGGYPVLISDTAGIRANPASAIEQEGIRRSYARSAEANVVLWLIDGTAPLPSPPSDLQGQRTDIIAVLTKTDLAQPTVPSAAVAISTRTGDGMTTLIELLGERAAAHLGSGDAPVITTARQRSLVSQAHGSLGDYLANSSDQPELRAEDLRQAAQALGRLTGRVDVEDVLDRVFSAFCIGK